MFTDAFGKIWYKGNLHTHTTNSDGAYTPEETIALYKSKGYDFLALTDHWFHGEGRQEENFLLLNGTEFDVGSTVPGGHLPHRRHRHGERRLRLQNARRGFPRRRLSMRSIT